MVLDFLRDGDELVVVKLDRLGRSIRDVLNLVSALASCKRLCGAYASVQFVRYRTLCPRLFSGGSA